MLDHDQAPSSETAPPSLTKLVSLISHLIQLAQLLLPVECSAVQCSAVQCRLVPGQSGCRLIPALVCCTDYGRTEQCDCEAGGSGGAAP